MLNTLQRKIGINFLHKDSLFRVGAYSFFAQVVNRLLLFFISVVLVRALAPSEYGVYVLAFAILNILIMIVEAGIPVLLMRECASYLEGKKYSLLRGLLVRSFQAILLLSSIVISLGLIVVNEFKTEEYMRLTLYFVFLALPFMAYINVTDRVLRGLNHVLQGQLLSLVYRPTLTIIILVLIFNISEVFKKPHYSMLVVAVSAVVVSIISYFSLNRKLPEYISNAIPLYDDKVWAKSAFWFGLMGGAGIINNVSDILMLGWLTDTTQVGLYQVAVQGALIVAFAIQVADSVLAPEFAKTWASQNISRLKKISKTSARIVLAISLPIAITFYLVGEYLIALVFGVEYVEANTPLLILTTGQLANAFFGSVGLILAMAGYEKEVNRVMWTTAGVNIVLNGLLIPVLGGSGAAIASALSLVLWNYLLYIKVLNKMSISTHAL